MNHIETYFNHSIDLLEKYGKLVTVDFAYTNNPHYFDCLFGAYKTILWYFRGSFWSNQTVSADNVYDFLGKFDFNFNDLLPMIYTCIFFTFLRYMFEFFVCKPLLSYLNFDRRSDGKKFPESLWKFVVYSIQWGYVYYLLIYTGKYDYFHKPFNMWEGWNYGMPIPSDIKLIYFVEGGFYLHSIYSTMFMDEKRKDHIIMLLHHLVTIALIILSYGFRYHRLGLMVLFCHDCQDVLLEFTKCNVYLRKRNGKYYYFNDTVGHLAFVVFTFTWFLFRLYWFPVKILYVTSVISAHRMFYRIECPLVGSFIYGIFNALLAAILLLNIYWFLLILLIVYKIFRKHPGYSQDIRDYEETKKDKKQA